MGANASTIHSYAASWQLGLETALQSVTSPDDVSIVQVNHVTIMPGSQTMCPLNMVDSTRPTVIIKRVKQNEIVAALLDEIRNPASRCVTVFRDQMKKVDVGKFEEVRIRVAERVVRIIQQVVTPDLLDVFMKQVRSSANSLQLYGDIVCFNNDVLEVTLNLHAKIIANGISGAVLNACNRDDELYRIINEANGTVTKFAASTRRSTRLIDKSDVSTGKVVGGTVVVVIVAGILFCLWKRKYLRR